MFFFGFGVLKFNRWTKHTPGRWMRKHQAMQCWCNCCKKTKALADEKRMVGKKLFLDGWGLLIGGCVFLFVGGTALKGGSLSELPKTVFFNNILIRNRSFGRWCFFSVLASWNVTDGPNTSLGGGWGNIRQCNVDVAVAEKQKQLHMRKAWWKKNSSWLGGVY